MLIATCIHLTTLALLQCLNGCPPAALPAFLPPCRSGQPLSLTLQLAECGWWWPLLPLAWVSSLGGSEPGCSLHICC